MSSGIRVPRILLLPFGGLASIELPEKPLLELKVALAGPLINFAVVLGSLVVFYLTPLDIVSYSSLLAGFSDGSLNLLNLSAVFNLFFWINLVLGVFNMLPAFPMDGGRVFRSVLALWVDYLKATRMAALVGQMIFSLFVLYGLFVMDLWLILIGGFLWFAGGSELKYTGLRKLFHGIRLRDVVYKVPYVNGSLSVKEFLERVASPRNMIYLVSDSAGSLKGVLNLDSLPSSAGQRGDVKLSDLASTEYTVLNADLRVSDALRALIKNDLCLVVDSNLVLGCVTMDYLMKLKSYYLVMNRLGG